MAEITEAMTTELQRAVGRVTEARARAQEAQSEYDASQLQWQNLNQRIVIYRTAMQQERLDAEVALRALTLAVYQDTGNKAPIAGVGIREITKIEYPAQDALAWAKEHDMALTLDVKAFEKIALASPMPFVTLKKEATATIATKL